MKEEVINQYVDRILDLFKITREDFFKKEKKRNLVDARHLLYYLCSERNIKQIIIRDFMRKNGHNIPHQSVRHGIEIVREKVQEDKDYQSIVKEIEKSVFI
jgi:chromosomal replication initiation ATPase DnaA